MPDERKMSLKNKLKKSKSEQIKPPPIEDEGVFDTYMSNRISLRYFLSKFMITSQDIDDISQEAFLRAFREEKKRKIDQPKAFIFRIAQNLVFSKFNKRLRKITDYIEDFEHVDLLKSDALEDQLMAQQKLGIYCEAMATLPEQCRRVMLMKKIYGMSHKEIANRLGIAVSTVEKHMAKGMRQTTAIITSRYDGGLRPMRRESGSDVYQVKKYSEKHHD